MLKKFDVDVKVGDIVSAYPAAAEVFMTYNIDFCCGGSRTLQIAAEEKGIDSVKILSELNKKYEAFVNEKPRYEDYNKYSSKKLIDHIVDIHHKYLWEEMPKLSKLTLKILSVHGDKHPELLEKVKSLYEDLRKELEQHLKKEEEVLFPLMEAYDHAKEGKEKKNMQEGIRSLKNEHENAGNILKKLRETTQDYTVPDDVCGTFAMAFMKLKEMERDIFTHIHLENNILFKRYEE